MLVQEAQEGLPFQFLEAGSWYGALPLAATEKDCGATLYTIIESIGLLD